MDILFLSAREGVLSSSTSFESYAGRTRANTTPARFDLSSISAARLTRSTLTSRVYGNPDPIAFVRHNDNLFSFCLRQR